MPFATRREGNEPPLHCRDKRAFFFNSWNDLSGVDVCPQREELVCLRERFELDHVSTER